MEKEEANNNKLTTSEIRKFKSLLQAKLNKLLGNVLSMENEALHQDTTDLSKLPFHMADLGTDCYDQEFTLGLMDSERKLLEQVNEALHRIEEGTYGICEGTGKQIQKQRLEAIPWARYCLEYARLLENGLVREKDSFIESIFYDQMDEE